jgi:hypothetical protein
VSVNTSKLALTVLGVLALTAGCRRLGSSLHGPPPFEPYVKGEYRSPITGKVSTPPEPALGRWQVIALQTEPRPKENPKWSSMSVSDSGELTMPRGSMFRCIYNPTKFRAVEGESPSGLDGWELMREVRCSDNGFRTSVSAAIRFVVDPEGKVRVRSGERAELELTEVLAGRPTHVSIMLRPEGAG